MEEADGEGVGSGCCGAGGAGFGLETTAEEGEADFEGFAGAAAGGAAGGFAGAEAGGRGVDAGGRLPAGGSGLGAETPAMSEPSPIFCKLGASSFPLGSRSLADWNFCSAFTVFASHLPLGSAWK